MQATAKDISPNTERLERKNSGGKNGRLVKSPTKGGEKQRSKISLDSSQISWWPPDKGNWENGDLQGQRLNHGYGKGQHVQISVHYGEWAKE